MELAQETVTDLLRSSWVVEAARSELYRRWASADPSLTTRAEGAAARATLVEEALGDVGRSPDTTLVDAHRGWIQNLVGDQPGDVALGDLFVARLGDWVEAHIERFLGERGPKLKELGDRERALLSFPDDLPSAPAFEPLEPVDVDPPGDVVFRFAILGDLHFGSPGAEERGRATIADINSSGAELVIQLGDLTDQGQRDEFEQAVKVLAELDMPCTTMMGNHDVFARDEQRLTGRDYYGNSFGRQPDGVMLEHKGFRFAVLDSATESTSPFAPFDFVTGGFTEGRGGAVVHGSLTVPQHEILADVAAPNTPPAFVFLHHPPQPFAGFPPILFGLRESDSGRLRATADSGNVWGIFAGHTHRNARTTNYNGVPAHEVAIPRDFPFGFALVDVTAQGYAYRFLQLSDEDLLREAYTGAGQIHRRYGLGRPDERGFVWTKGGS